MIKFTIGIVVGLLIGWNVFPQPAWVKRQYGRVVAKIATWTGLVLFVATLAGCDSVLPDSKPDIGFAKERAMAEIAIASVTAEQSPAPDSTPNVGDKCPTCNDPPGRCGVGKVGDGVTCDTCRKCGGDGRIDDRDLSGEFQSGMNVTELEWNMVPDPVPEVIETPEIQKEVILHMTNATKRAWPSKWFAQDREQFEKSGWIVRAILEPESVTKVAYFDVVAPDGEVLQFYQPITLNAKDAEENGKVNIRHLETR